MYIGAYDKRFSGQNLEEGPDRIPPSSDYNTFEANYSFLTKCRSGKVRIGKSGGSTIVPIFKG